MNLLRATFISTFVIPFVSVDGSIVVYENLPSVGTASFGYSDAFSSGGMNWQRQSMAQGFSLDQGHQLDSLRWWGSMNNYFQSGLSNLAGFEIVVFNEDFSQQVATRIVPISMVDAVPTGSPNGTGGEVYEFFAPLDVALGPGTYRINVGALYHGTNQPGESPWAVEAGGFDQWIWAAGRDFDPDLPQRTNLFITANFPSMPWGTWVERMDAPVGIRSQAQGGALVVYAVPEPGAISLLGIAALVVRKRRR